MNVFKDQLIMKDNVIRNLESKLTTSNDHLASAQNEIYNLQLKLGLSQQETKSLPVHKRQICC